MSETGHFNITRYLHEKESLTMALPLLKDDMKRLIGSIVQDRAGQSLMIDLKAPTFDEETLELRQEVFIAKCSPLDCEIDDWFFLGWGSQLFVYQEKGYIFKAVKNYPWLYRRIL